MARDITKVKNTEAVLAAVAMSEIAGPLVHDFNNALAAINGFTTLIDEDLDKANPMKTEIAQIIIAVKRAAEVTSRLQALAKNPLAAGYGRKKTARRLP